MAKVGGQSDVPAAGPLGPGFWVSHQSLELELDFATKSLRGKTEITIHPTHKDLKTIRLNTRQCLLRRLNINGRGPTVKYQEPYSRFHIHTHADVHQHHMLRQKLAVQLKEPPEEELVINLPKSVRIEELDPLAPKPRGSMSKKQGAATERESEEVGASVATPTFRAVDEQGIRYSPLTIYIEFTVDNFRDGLHFVGFEEDDLRYPHIYTRNSTFPGSASCLFPCVDDASSRCMWDISLKCPRTLADAMQDIHRGPASESHAARTQGSTVPDTDVPMAQTEEVSRDDSTAANDPGAGPSPAKSNDQLRTSPVLSAEDAARDMLVVCSGELADEVVDPADPTKKVVSFAPSTAIAARDIAFAIGPFEYVDLAEFRESDEDEKLGQNAVRLHGYCLPGRTQELKNTCFPIAKAIDYFTLTYGSYPFSSYALCFVDELASDLVPAASVTICSNRLLFPENIIEPLDRVTRQLVHALVYQWIGITIIPKEPTDTWITVGIAHFITDLFMKKLCGNNEYRFRQKKAAERVCELDVGRPSLSTMGFLIALDPTELEFLALKSSMVLFILDRRLAKASGSSGLSRIISRIFLNAKVGELANGCITAAQFHRTCEKLGHTKLDVFFQQWVFGAGCPRFIVTQRFNKKKLVVEMLIRQVQGDHIVAQNLDTNHFMRDVKQDLHKITPEPVQSVFTGPMTIRIHEADGTPYEHIVEIREASTKFEIPYNTKYKRLKRSRRQKERAAAATGADIIPDAHDDVLLYCLGDVLQSEDEVRSWRLADWSKDDEDKMNQESYEWIRMDADFEWICQMSISMPGYMYLSQLQQDRDVVAQYESIQYIASQSETHLVSTILVRTLMDRRYFHGIRTAAAHALASCGKDELDWIGLFHLEKAFREFFCFTDSPMTRSNDFSDRTAYYIQCAIPQAIAKVRDQHGSASLRVKQFLLDLLKFNDNSNNQFSDCHYLATVMTALCDSLITGKEGQGFSGYDDDDENYQEKKMLKDAVQEIDRYRRLDEWIPTYHNVCSMTALNCKRRLVEARILQADVPQFFLYTRPGNFDTLRVSVFADMVAVGTLKRQFMLRYILRTLSQDPSPYIRDAVRQIFVKGLAAIAVGEGMLGNAGVDQDELIIEQESTTAQRQAELARKQTVAGALAALKEEMGSNKTLQEELWLATTSPYIGLPEIRDLLDICGILYEPKTSLLVKLKLPQYWKVEHLGKGVMRFSRNGRYRTEPMAPLVTRAPSPPASSPPSGPAARKGENPTKPAGPRITLKTKRPHAASAAAEDPSPQTQPDPKRLKLKINFKKAGGGKGGEGSAGAAT